MNVGGSRRRRRRRTSRQRAVRENDGGNRVSWRSRLGLAQTLDTDGSVWLECSSAMCQLGGAVPDKGAVVSALDAKR